MGPAAQILDTPMDAFTIAGFVGAALVVAAYFANQQRWLSSEDWRFPLANFVGALLILASLWSAWNFPSAVIEGFWALISLYGLVLRLRGRHRPPTVPLSGN